MFTTLSQVSVNEQNACSRVFTQCTCSPEHTELHPGEPSLSLFNFSDVFIFYGLRESFAVLTFKFLLNPSGQPHPIWPRNCK